MLTSLRKKNTQCLSVFLDGSWSLFLQGTSAQMKPWTYLLEGVGCSWRADGFIGSCDNLGGKWLLGASARTSSSKQCQTKFLGALSSHIFDVSWRRGSAISLGNLFSSSLSLRGERLFLISSLNVSWCLLSVIIPSCTAVKRLALSSSPPC